MLLAFFLHAVGGLEHVLCVGHSGALVFVFVIIYDSAGHGVCVDSKIMCGLYKTVV